MTDRYWFDNRLSDEGERLRLLEKIADPRSISLLNGLGVHLGSKCAELGAGGGSMASWLADRVGEPDPCSPSIATSACVVTSRSDGTCSCWKATLRPCDWNLRRFDLVHTRNVLMHVDDPDRIIEEIVRALRPGGRYLARRS